MIIEDYKRVNGWLNIRVNPMNNQSLYDFSEYDYDMQMKHTLSEAQELYEKYITKSL